MNRFLLRLGRNHFPGALCFNPQPAPSFKPIARLPNDPTFEEIREAGGEPVLTKEGHTICDGQVWVSGEIERLTEFENGLIGGIEWVNGEWDRESGQVRLHHIIAAGTSANMVSSAGHG